MRWPKSESVNCRSWSKLMRRLCASAACRSWSNLTSAWCACRSALSWWKLNCTLHRWQKVAAGAATSSLNPPANRHLRPRHQLQPAQVPLRPAREHNRAAHQAQPHLRYRRSQRLGQYRTRQQAEQAPVLRRRNLGSLLAALQNLVKAPSHNKTLSDVQRQHSRAARRALCRLRQLPHKTDCSVRWRPAALPCPRASARARAEGLA